MGLYGWLARRGTPEIDDHEYLPSEVEDIALEATTIGCRRGFLLGFPAGVLVMAMFIGAVAMAGLYLYLHSASMMEPGQSAQDATASQALTKEMNTLREENKALKKQVEETSVAATCPPCQPQTAGKNQTESPVAAPAAKPSKQMETKAAAPPIAGIAARGGNAAQPIPSNCRQEGDCQPPGPQRVAAPIGAAAPATAPTPVAKAESSPRVARSGLAIVVVRTSQDKFVTGVPIAFHFLDGANHQIGGVTVATDPSGRATTVIPAGTACAEFRLPSEYIVAGRVKPEISSATGLPLAPGVFRTCGEILTDPNGILGVFTID